MSIGIDHRQQFELAIGNWKLRSLHGRKNRMTIIGTAQWRLDCNPEYCLYQGIPSKAKSKFVASLAKRGCANSLTDDGRAHESVEVWREFGPCRRVILNFEQKDTTLYSGYLYWITISVIE